MKTGKVYLVGAGPGDEKLMTVRGMECLRQADTIVYDRLANPRLLTYAKPGAEFIYCGKLPKRHTLRQEGINALLVEKAKEGKNVVRLKGGDPAVFGRVGEEAAELAASGIAYEIVPGITAGIAAPAYAGIPVTHREYGTTFAMVTGHDKSIDGRPSIHWPSLARGIDTIAFYMGVSNLPYICEQLIMHGKSPETPIALIRWGTMGRQQTLEGTLETIVKKVAESDFTNPAIIIVGEIVTLREKIKWYEKKPLFGRQILVVRTGGVAGRIAEALLDQGADVIEYPYFFTRPTCGEKAEEVFARIGMFERILFTSPDSAAFFFKVFFESGRDIRSMQAQLYTLSGRTKKKLRALGLASEDAASMAGEGKLLIVGDTSSLSDEKRYRAAWGGCEMLAVYEKEESKEYGKRMLWLLQEENVDTVIFPSAASVRTLTDSLSRSGMRVDDVLSTAEIVCMGEKSAQAAKEAGYHVEHILRSPNLDDLVAYLTNK
ncbi:uroporphyrinogen-III C-methyltransferase [Aneurinibacillus terranovensis]|uniref:uroporphyrinogen-III C-methyltransferase n=1 Tax=Aneurinibacillus terranovensis TaxID=278991 RepID=UPI0003F4C9A0|nr:uroporphyrinogen-III C-methyltransferase [Aneurinibacillus terranovensis]